MAIDQDTLLRTLLSERAKVLAFIRSIVRRRDLAEDIFQDVCVLALEKKDTIVDEKHLSAWLRTTARLHTMNVIRKKQNRQIALDSSVLDSLEDEWRKHDQPNGPAMGDALGECVRGLNEKARRLVTERYTDGMSMAEVAERRNRPIGSVYVTMSRIHSALADCVSRRMSKNGGVRG